MSKAGMLNVLQKLSLTPGDVLVVKDFETLRFLDMAKLPLKFTVPLVFAPHGIEKLSKQDLLNLLEQLEQAQTPSQPFADSPSAPL